MVEGVRIPKEILQGWKPIEVYYKNTEEFLCQLQIVKLGYIGIIRRLWLIGVTVFLTLSEKAVSGKCRDVKTPREEPLPAG